MSLNGIMGAAEDDNGVLPPTPTFYRTGDADVRLPSGELAYRGRSVHQPRTLCAVAPPTRSPGLR